MGIFIPGSGKREPVERLMKKITSTMKDLPAEELPYEKCVREGAEVLSDAELLAVILRSGSRGINALELSREILEAGIPEKGLLGLYHLSIPQLRQIKGVGEVKAVQLKCIAELSRRIARQSGEKTLNFKDASTIADYFMEELSHLEQEQMVLLMLDTKCRLLARQFISKGSINCSVISPREIFLLALQHHAVFIILLHNHPSGDPSPSEEDKSFTKRISLGGELVGIRLLDHIIVGDRCYVSFREMKIL